ncbi:MAG TPA: 23S rRNA (guanosine(2251)-2'-O)-methyltransferase RlmB [Actinomycetaceae bacterium]|nr:23S rRNA (guanosine(2251)-2'-O)-methyltransferase RlmB [Actinomycetaceae bacterium]
MAGNPQRGGGAKKAQTGKGGSGVKRRRGLEGRGPTPKAEDREYHPAHARKVATERREAARPKRKIPSWVRQLPEGTEFVVGRNPVAEVAAAGMPMHAVYVASGMTTDERVSEVLQAATAAGTEMLEVQRADLDAISDGQNHQGIALAVPPFEYADVHDVVDDARNRTAIPLLVALDGVTDPHNLGAVIRSAGAFGADGVVIPTRRAAGVTASVWKVSAGAVARVPVARVTNLVRTLEELKADGFFAVGLDGGGDVDMERLELADSPLVIVTGAEGAGLSRLVRATCDVIASIPISRRVESLNAAVATGIGLYEISRLRRLEA